MFRPLECWIGLRYLRARGDNGFISFISLASMIGVAVGVAALIVILSVMNGFENELRDRLLGMTAHASLERGREGVEDWGALAAAAREHPRVIGAAPYVSIEGLLARGRQLQGTRIRGILPEAEPEVSRIGDYLRRGSLDVLEPGERRVLLGRALALTVGAETGSEVTLLVPEATADGSGIRPRLRRFTVAGIFEAGLADHDTGLVLVHMEDAAALAGRPGRASGVRLEFDDVFAAPSLVAEIAAALDTPGADPPLATSDWTREHASYFRAIRLEKTMMSTILLLIVAVAAFNIVASLVMVVTEKRADVAILRTLGLSARSVRTLFMVQGSIIGVTGTVLGVTLGVVLALNVETVVPWLESTFGFQIMPGDVYYVTEIPSELRAGDVTLIGIAALVLAMLATIYPSRRAASIAPAEALRYE